MGRATQGVRLINLKSNDSIAAVAKVDVEEEAEVLYDEEGNIIASEGDELSENSNISSEEAGSDEESGKDIDNTENEN